MKFYLSVLSFAYFYLFLVSSKAVFAWAKCIVPYMKVVQAQMIPRYVGLFTMYIQYTQYNADNLSLLTIELSGLRCDGLSDPDLVRSLLSLLRLWPI